VKEGCEYLLLNGEQEVQPGVSVGLKSASQLFVHVREFDGGVLAAPLPLH
jgi:hypothetical protein